MAKRGFDWWIGFSHVFPVQTMTISGKQSDPQNPLGDLEEWDDFLKERYPEPADKHALVGTNAEKTEEQFRDYEADARSSVREFYRLNHRGQTLDFVRQKRDEYLSLNQREMGVWEAAEFLNTLIDDSDPDTDLSQLEHLLQTLHGIVAMQQGLNLSKA